MTIGSVGIRVLSTLPLPGLLFRPGPCRAGDITDTGKSVERRHQALQGPTVSSTALQFGWSSSGKSSGGIVGAGFKPAPTRRKPRGRVSNPPLHGANHGAGFKPAPTRRKPRGGFQTRLYTAQTTGRVSNPPLHGANHGASFKPAPTRRKPPETERYLVSSTRLPNTQRQGDWRYRRGGFETRPYTAQTTRNGTLPCQQYAPSQHLAARGLSESGFSGWKDGPDYRNPHPENPLIL